MFCSEFYTEDTCVFNLGHNLGVEIRNKVRVQFGSDYDLQLIRQINIVAFSLGNQVVDVWLASELMNYNPADTFGSCILTRLGTYYSINGPHFGTGELKQIVKTGTGFIKAFTSEKSSRCIDDLSNKPIDIGKLREQLYYGC